MKRFSAYVIFLLILIVSVTVWMFFVPVPEEVVVTSEDGLVQVEGVTRESQPFTITENSQIGGEMLENIMYHIEPSEIILDVPVAIRLDASGVSGTPALYRYNEDFMMWEQLKTSSLGDGALELAVDVLGTFALGTSSPLADVGGWRFDEIIEMAPEGTVGYEMVTGISQGEGPVIISKHVNETGGCDGRFLVGAQEEFTALTSESNMIEGFEGTSFTLVDMAKWQIHPERGCAEGEDLKPVK